jgi:hypothetical protein
MWRLAKVREIINRLYRSDDPTKNDIADALDLLTDLIEELERD